MKSKRLVLFCLALGTIIAVGLLTLNVSTASENSYKQPTPAPTSNPDEPETGSSSTSVPLAQPLETQEQAINQVLYYDSRWAKWESPWSIETLSLDPQRLTVETYENRSTESKADGETEWYSPEVEADAGSIWAVTIKGNVQVSVIGGDPRIIYDGVTYVISSRTGNLLAIRTGLPIIDEKGNPILRDERGNIIDEQGNIIWEAPK